MAEVTLPGSVTVNNTKIVETLMQRLDQQSNLLTEVMPEGFDGNSSTTK